MIKKITTALAVLLILVSATPAYASPYQLISSESALLIPHLNFEVKENVIYSTGYIDDLGIRTQLRLGFFGWSELSCATSFNYYPGISDTDDLFMYYYNKKGYTDDNLEIENPRISYVEPKLKVRVMKLGSKSMLLLYGKYKILFGKPIVVPHDSYWADEEAVAVTTPTASQGKEATGGLVTKIVLSNDRYTIPIITVGGELVYLWDKDWMSERRESKYMPVVTVSPQLIFLKNWMIQLENRFEYWIKRGWHYEALPGIRWEIQPRAIFEVGIGVPFMGGDVKRYFVGFTYEFGKSELKKSRPRGGTKR